MSDEDLKVMEECISEITREDYNAYEAAEFADLSHLGAFTGEARLIKEDGSDDDFDSISYSDGGFFYYQLSNPLNLLGQAYQSINDAKEEIKEFFGECFPKDYDFKVRHIIGTYFG